MHWIGPDTKSQLEKIIEKKERDVTEKVHCRSNIVEEDERRLEVLRPMRITELLKRSKA